MKTTENATPRGVTLARNNPLVVCVYHKADNDGWTSKELINRQFHAVNYGYNYEKIDLCAFDQSVKELLTTRGMAEASVDILCMVDCALPLDIVKEYITRGCYILYIDHHKSSIKKYQDAGLIHKKVILSDNTAVDKLQTGIMKKHHFEYCITPNNTYCAAELTYAFCYANNLADPTTFHFSPWVKLVGLWDLWKVNHPQRLLAEYTNCYFHCYREVLSPDLLFAAATEINNIASRGKVMWEYQAHINKQLVQKQAFELAWHGLKFIAMNTSGTSKVFESIFDPDKYDAELLFYFDGQDGLWSISLYTDGVKNASIDLTSIAVEYGGGGHRSACGFRTDVLPFKLPTKFKE